MLRASFSQQAALRVWYSQRVLRASYSLAAIAADVFVIAAATAATATTTTAVAAVDPTRRIGMTGLLWGAREPCPAAAAAIVVMVVLVESILNPPYLEG
jgi:hypothetical protein